jgi:hypothetical protein
MTALMMKEVRTSETSVYFNETIPRYIPEDRHLHTRRRENLKLKKKKKKPVCVTPVTVSRLQIDTAHHPLRRLVNY